MHVKHHCISGSLVLDNQLQKTTPAQRQAIMVARQRALGTVCGTLQRHYQQ